MPTELESLIALQHVKSYGPITIKKMINTLGSAKKAFNSCEKQIPEKAWQETLALVEKYGVQLVPFYDPNYPKSLLALPDHPPLLYVLGELKPEDASGIAMVGTRTATVYGKQMATELAREIAHSGVSVISGLARGIDTAAHRGALEKGRTVAFIGSGLASLYPKENETLAQQIAKRGAVVSELPMQTPPARHAFPRRNRLICALSQSVLLVESPKKGGSMITMELAREQKKPCYALPGRMDVPSFEGNLSLLKKGLAHLVTEPSDLVRVRPTAKQVFLTEEEKRFMTKLPTEEKSIDALVLLTQLPVMKLNVLLTRLVMKKAIKEFPGKIYKKLL